MPFKEGPSPLALLISTFFLVKESRQIQYWARPFVYALIGLSPWLLRILYSGTVEGNDLDQLKILAIEGDYHGELFWQHSFYRLKKK